MSTTAPDVRVATYEDIERLPAGVVGEIIAGELVVSPRPSPRHTVSASALGTVVCGPFQLGLGGPGGWWILDEPELRLGIESAFDTVVPDLGGWRRERMPVLPRANWFETVPDWVCEILSPRTAAYDRAEKLPFYARAGIGHAWLVDPLAETLEVYRRDGDSWTVARVWRGDVTVRAEPFAAVEIPLAVLWDRGRQPRERSES